jgi:hypothetical protein
MPGSAVRVRPQLFSPCSVRRCSIRSSRSHLDLSSRWLDLPHNVLPSRRPRSSRPRLPRRPSPPSRVTIRPRRRPAPGRDRDGDDADGSRSRRHAHASNSASKAHRALPSSRSAALVRRIATRTGIRWLPTLPPVRGFPGRAGNCTGWTIVAGESKGEFKGATPIDFVQGYPPVSRTSAPVRRSMLLAWACRGTGGGDDAPMVALEEPELKALVLLAGGRTLRSTERSNCAREHDSPRHHAHARRTRQRDPPVQTRSTS